MPLSRDYLEAVLWPKYKDPARDLCQGIWGMANPKQAGVPSPAWFNEIVELQVKSILMLVFSTPQSWVVVPEPIPGFTLVVYKKPRGAPMAATQQKLSLRNHTFDQFGELAQLVERAAVRLVRRAVGAGSGDVVEMESEDGHVFVFPRAKMAQYLRALGFAEEQIPKLLSVEDIEGDFD